MRLSRCCSFGSVVGGEEIADLEIDFCCPAGSADAEPPPGRLNEPAESGQVKVVSSFELGDITLGHTESFRDLVLGESNGASDLGKSGVLGCEPVVVAGLGGRRREVLAHHQSVKDSRSVAAAGFERGNQASSRPSPGAAERLATPSSPASQAAAPTGWQTLWRQGRRRRLAGR